MREKVEGFLLWKAFLKIERFVMVLCSVAIVLTIVTNVVCRYVLHVTFDGYDEIVIILALWLYYVGGLYGNYEDCQIKADVLSVMVRRESVLKLFDIIQKILTLVISIILALWAIEYFQFCLKMGGKTAILHIPMMVSRFALVFGYVHSYRLPAACYHAYYRRSGNVLLRRGIDILFSYLRIYAYHDISDNIRKAFQRSSFIHSAVYPCGKNNGARKDRRRTY